MPEPVRKLGEAAEGWVQHWEWRGGEGREKRIAEKYTCYLLPPSTGGVPCWPRRSDCTERR